MLTDRLSLVIEVERETASKFINYTRSHNTEHTKYDNLLLKECTCSEHKWISSPFEPPKKSKNLSFFSSVITRAESASSSKLLAFFSHYCWCCCVVNYVLHIHCNLYANSRVEAAILFCFTKFHFACVKNYKFRTSLYSWCTRVTCGSLFSFRFNSFSTEVEYYFPLHWNEDVNNDSI